MTALTYDEAIAYILSFADFETSGRFQDRPDVAPMLALLRALGDPHLGRLTVHVAGSKGKGSVSAMIESILRTSGRRPPLSRPRGRGAGGEGVTGLYTSPHLHDYTERIRINGAPVSRETFARLVSELRPVVEDVGAAIGERRFVTFDLLTAMAFLAFREAGVTAQVIEVGLGGRVDSTNVFASKEVAVITPLSFEHTAVLGDAIEQIAAEKAGIITPGCTVVLAPQAFPEAAAVVRDVADEVGARLVDVASDYRWRVFGHDLGGQDIRIEGPHGAIEARLPLLGATQADNAATAVAAVEALEEILRDALRAPQDERWHDAVRRSLESVRWPGRLEVLRERPLVVADGAHNRESARRLREALAAYFGACESGASGPQPGQEKGGVLFIIGASADKDIEGLAEELAPLAGMVIAAKSAHPRAMETPRIVAAFQRLGVPAEDVDSVGNAIERALAASDSGGVICLAGSLFVAAEGREYFGRVEHE